MQKEADFLAATGNIRAKYLRESPKDIFSERDKTYLVKLNSLYFPASQPRNNCEEAYLSLMRDCICARLSQL